MRMLNLKKFIQNVMETLHLYPLGCLKSLFVLLFFFANSYYNKNSYIILNLYYIKKVIDSKWQND